MMCSMSPPVGFGKKCPKIVGYKVSETFTTTLQTLMDELKLELYLTIIPWARVGYEMINS